MSDEVRGNATETSGDNEASDNNHPMRPVVVTTQWRGVFFGYTDQSGTRCVVLKQPRMCVAWRASIKGVMGLAAVGPDEQCRVSMAPPEIELHGVTAIMEMTPEAVERWETAPWGD